MKSENYHKLFKVGMATALVTSAVVVVPSISEAKGKDESDKKDDKGHNKPITVVDKSQLYTAIQNASSLPKASYTADSWNKFEQALSAAQKVVKDSKATQAAVTKALNNLKEATAKLVLKKDPAIASVVTFKELKAAINNPKVKTIQLNKNIKLTETLKVSSEKHINGMDSH